jgi:hypothetical protein
VKSKQKIFFVCIVGPKNSKPVKSKKKRRNIDKNPGNTKIKICEMQTNKKTDFCLDFAICLFGFPGFLKESWKSKLKYSQIQTIIRENPNQNSSFFIVWISPILCLCFPDFSFGFALLIQWWTFNVFLTLN